MSPLQGTQPSNNLSLITRGLASRVNHPLSVLSSPLSLPCSTRKGAENFKSSTENELRLRLRRNTTSRPPKLSLVLPTHLDFIPRPLPTFPKPSRPFLTHHAPMTDPTILGPVVLLPTTPPTDHSIGPLVGMFLSLIMAFVTSIDFQTATEAKPSVALGIVTAAASFGELGAWR